MGSGQSTRWVYQLNPFPNESPFMAVVSLLCFLPYHYQHMNFYSTINSSFYNIHNFLSDYAFNKLVPQSAAVVGYVLIPLLTMVTVVSAVYNEDKYQGARYLLAWVGSRLFPVLRILM